MNLAIDFGNSRTKAAIFSEKKMIHVESHASHSISISRISFLLRKFSVTHSIFSSVIKNKAAIESLLKRKTQFFKLTSSTHLPILNHYHTPRTLGSDRLANLTGAHSLFPKTNVLVISAGTCITYDVITAGGNYFGGNITPGLDMRLKAMNTFTARLPLVKKKMTKDLFGKTTAASMLTGVITGAALEMEGFISEYKKTYPRLKVIITGGDSSFFKTTIHGIPYRKSKTFAVPHLVLYGLNEILRLNDAKA